MGIRAGSQKPFTGVASALVAAIASDCCQCEWALHQDDRVWILDGSMLEALFRKPPPKLNVDPFLKDLTSAAFS